LLASDFILPESLARMVIFPNDTLELVFALHARPLIPKNVRQKLLIIQIALPPEPMG